MKKILSLVLLLFLVFSLASCITIEEDTTGTKSTGNVTTNGDETSDQTTVEASTLEETDEKTTQATTTEAPEPQVATVGQYVQGEKWKISLLDAKVYDEVGEDFLITEPEEGNKFLILFFEVQNISNEDDYFNRFYVESYVNGYNQSEKILLTDVDGYSALTGDVAAGKKLKGYLAWEIGSDFEELELSYNDGFIVKDKHTFLVKPENISNYNVK